MAFEDRPHLHLAFGISHAVTHRIRIDCLISHLRTSWKWILWPLFSPFDAHFASIFLAISLRNFTLQRQIESIALKLLFVFIFFLSIREISVLLLITRVFNDEIYVLKRGQADEGWGNSGISNLENDAKREWNYRECTIWLMNVSNFQLNWKVCMFLNIRFRLMHY